MKRGSLALASVLILAGCADFHTEGDWAGGQVTGTPATPTPNGTPTPAQGSPTALRINEVLAYVPDTASAIGDANGDGQTDASDQFVEIVNTSDTQVSLDGVTLVVGSPSRKVLAFSSQSKIQAGGVLVVFSNGTVTSNSATCNSSMLQMGTLGLNGMNDTVSLVSNEQTIDTVSWSNAAIPDTSTARSPDFIGSFISHPVVTDAMGDIRSFSPGCRVDASPF